MAGSSNGRSAPSRSRRSSSRGTRVATPPKPTGRKRFFDYPRTGYSGLHRWIPSWRVVVGTILGMGFLLVGGLVGAYASVKVPAKGAEDTQAQTSTVYYANKADGSQGDVMGTYAVQKREIVEYDTLPDYVGKAVVAGEDRSFFTSSAGISLTGMARAFLHNATTSDGTVQGGSTLTQQYVERYYVDKTTRDYVGKFREALLAIKIARTESKEEILGRYLNTIYFGRDSYGVQAASQAYFGIDAKDMDVSQAALLAAVIPSPNNWDPAVNQAKSEARWNIILDGMQQEGWVSATERAKLTFPDTIEYKRTERYRGSQGYLLQMVEDELASGPTHITKSDLERGGYKVVTTIQKPVQKDMNATASDFLKGKLVDDQKPNKRTKLAMASVDPSSGAIVALYGGPDFITDQINRASVDTVQAGSTFKPFTLLAALEDGKTLTTRYAGYSPQKPKGWGQAGDPAVQNFGNEQFGYIDLVTATAQSVNTVYAQLNLDIGPEKTVAAAAAAGITTPITDQPSNVLGTADVHPLEMANAYATLAAQGVRHQTYIVQQVDNSDGSVAYANDKPKSKRAFPADVVADATYAMQQVVQSGSGKNYVKPLGRPIAGKTGTSQDNRSAWFVGFTPQISTAVALSQVGEDGKSRDTITPIGYKFGSHIALDAVTGGSIPARIWASYMGGVFEQPQYEDVVDFPPRANVGPTATSRPTQSATPSSTPTPTETETAPTVDRVPTGLVGKLQADATSVLYQAGLSATITSEYSDDVIVGRVIRVDPGEGKKIEPGGSVTLVISLGPKPGPTSKPTQIPTIAPTNEPTTKPTKDPDPNPTQTGGSGDGQGEDG
ncbi:transglycosylase domain-containing protein [Cellulomonas sp. HZM]|uniref:transglycosylase domain-containing protein n=1 Tax=Cellulomonas sp. HZM TaxID=1454010 RepID=UPI00055754CE|nr:transglycosylase domain-containing protein [Cellulomonas sp. HZM]